LYLISISWRLQKIAEWAAALFDGKKANATSKYRGVCKDLRRFSAFMGHPLTGKLKGILRGRDEKSCALAYDRQMLKWWGRYVWKFSSDHIYSQFLNKNLGCLRIQLTLIHIGFFSI